MYLQGQRIQKLSVGDNGCLTRRSPQWGLGAGTERLYDGKVCLES